MPKENKKRKLKRIIRALVPGTKDFSLFFRTLIIFLIGATFVYTFLYTAKPAQADTATPNKSIFNGVIAGGIGYAATGELHLNKDASAVFNTVAGADTIKLNTTSAASENPTDPQQQSGFMQINFGGTGSLINATANIYSTEIARPAEVVQYYASRAKGEAYAANPTSGREVLAPIFFLSQAMRNVAYGIIVIVLIASSISILMASLSGGEQKLSIVQLMMNTGLSLILATFFYEIAAILYDLCVNYGNAVVSSIMEPFINAQVILDRLQPGGDLNITAMLNTFQFVGVTDAFTGIMKNVTAGLGPVITQSVSAIPENTIHGPGNAIGAALGFFSGGVSSAINLVASNLLGSNAVFDAIIGWTIFILNIKIFFNLLDAFIKFNMYTAFGPILVLQGVNGGFEKIKNLFKLMAAYALVFPVTFLFILLGATTMNIYIRDGSSGSVEKSVLCTYSVSDPQYTEDGILGRTEAGRGLNTLFGFDDASYDDPKAFRERNFLNQNIYDSKPAYNANGVRSCRSNLFPVPWTFVPAPFGNYGNRLVQAQTIDSLVRTFMAIAFLIMAGRTPQLLVELLEAKELRSLQGLGKALLGGAAPAVGFGMAALGSSMGMLFKSTAGAAKVGLPLKLPNWSVLPKGLRGWNFRTNVINKPNGMFSKIADFGAAAKADNTSLADIYGALSKPTPNTTALAAKSTGAKLKSVDDALRNQGFSDEQRNLYMDKFIMPTFQQSLQASSQQLGTLNNMIGAGVGLFGQLNSQLGDLVGNIKNLTNMISANLVEGL
jgi:hypothetical protein